MTFTFKPAVRERVSVLLALAGASGAGKTKTALLLAEGMSPEGRIAFVDTEARRGLHYAEDHRFLHAPMSPPFRPERFVEALEGAEKSGADVAIFDSFSHEYDGEDGILDWAAAIEAGGTKSPGNWKVPKLAHKRMMNRILQSPISLIFCLRADEKIKIERDGGRTQVIPLGWSPICEKRFMFEMTASFTLTPEAPGMPRFDLPHKLQEQHRAMFPDGQHIGRDAGAALAAWARGGTLPASSDPLTALIAAGEAACADGAVALGQWGTTLTAADKKLLGRERIDAWKARAQQEAA